MPTREPADLAESPSGYLSSDALGQSIPAEVDDAIENTPGEIKGNFLKVAAFQIILRTGWIFKTESIVMPAVLDSIAGAGWLRGILPMLNRFGQSIPPLLASGYVTQTPLKKRILSACAMLMGGSFLTLSFIWHWTDGNARWLPLAFLMIYGVFFVGVGILNLSLSTLIGKSGSYTTPWSIDAVLEHWWRDMRCFVCVVFVASMDDAGKRKLHKHFCVCGNGVCHCGSVNAVAEGNAGPI